MEDNIQNMYQRARKAFHTVEYWPQEKVDEMVQAVACASFSALRNPVAESTNVWPKSKITAFIMVWFSSKYGLKHGEISGNLSPVPFF